MCVSGWHKDVDVFGPVRGPVLQQVFDDMRRKLGVAGLTEDEMRKRLEMLRIEHRDLDAAIDALSGTGAHDQLQVARLKKRKLLLKDQITLLEDYLIPDIIA